MIDHVNEETIQEVKDRGFWAAFSIYPHSKMTAERMVALVKTYGAERLIVDSACDWGVSDPLSVPKTAKLMAEQGLSEAERRQVSFYFTAGTQNQDPRGLMLDGEATLIVSGIPAAAGLVDLYYLMARTTWVSRQEEIDRLLPPPSGFMRRIARVIRAAL